MLLVSLRKRISVLDGILVLVLSARIRIVNKIGEVKRSLALPVTNLAREREVVRNLQSQLGPINSPGDILLVFQPVWKKIITTSKKFESVIVTSFLGPTGSYTGEIISFLNKPVGSLVYQTLRELNYQINRSDLVIAPLKNNCSGPVVVNANLVSKLNISIASEISSRVKHHLLKTSSGELGKFNLGSQQYALKQCSFWLINADVVKVKLPSTSRAKNLTVNLRNLLSFTNNQETIASQNYTNNTTTFVIVTNKNKSTSKSNCERSIVTTISDGNSSLLVLIVILLTKLNVNEVVIMPLLTSVVSVLQFYRMNQRQYQHQKSHIRKIIDNIFPLNKMVGLYFGPS